MRNILLGLLFFILFFSNSGFSQKQIDSLKTRISVEKNDSIKIMQLLQLGDLFEYSIPDSAIFYYYKALKQSKNIGNQELISRCLNYLGIVYTSISNYDKAIKFFNESLSIAKKIKNNVGIANCYNNIGRIYKDQGKYKEAVNYYLKSIKLYDELDNKLGMAYTYGNIGNIHTEQKNGNEAVEYYNLALKLFKELNHKQGISYCYNNIGIIHEGQTDYDKSIENYKKSLEIKIQLDDKKGISISLSNIGYVYQLKGDYKNAYNFYDKSLKIDTELGYKKDIALDYNNLAGLYVLYADSVATNKNEKLKYLNKTIEYAKKSMKIAEELKSIPLKNATASILMIAYEKKGDYKSSTKFSKLYISTKDSLYSIEKTKILVEMESKYKAEKNKLQLEKLEKQKQLDKKTIEAQQAENFKQLIIIISAIVGLVLVLMFSLVVLKMFRQKQRANKLLVQKSNEIIEKNEELNQQKEELKTLNDNLMAQNEKIKTQRDEIESIHSQVSESIDYATRLQESILPLSENLTKYFPNQFVLFIPKDKVSGDFYWWTNIENQTIITVADCTGHGVPGAIMSTLGISFLREIIVKDNCLNPAEILSKLRTEVIRALKQKPDYYETVNKLSVKDGMDMAVISINRETNTIHFAGANNPLCIVKNGKLKVKSKAIKLDELANPQLYEIKPDKMPISIYRNMKDFTNHEIQLEKGDKLYMFSDGYADQFGGKKGKKLKSKVFKKLILENADKPMAKQKEILESTFLNWKGKYEQIDDVTVLGVEI